MITFTVKDKIYRVPVTFIVSTWDERCKYLNDKYKLEEEQEQKFFGGQCDWLKDDFSFNMLVIWLPSFDINNLNDIVTLSHEIDHAGLYIMEAWDIPIVAKQSNHGYICLKDFIFYEALKKLKKQQEK